MLTAFGSTNWGPYRVSRNLFRSQAIKLIGASSAPITQMEAFNMNAALKLTNDPDKSEPLSAKKHQTEWEQLQETKASFFLCE
jgi:hypothetical protein